MTKRIASALLLCAIVAAPLAAQRLPRTVVPSHYDLTLAPDLEAETFDGRVSIDVSVAEPVDAIELHALEIEIDRAVVRSDGAEHDADVSFDEDRQTATLALPVELSRGPAVIEIDYRGLLNPDLRGFYIGESESGKYAASQMEALDARRAFPSFDEPWMKATFDVTMVVDERYVAFTNGAQLSDTPGPEPGQHTLEFATTPRMSTYLVALVVGEFDCLEDEHDGVPLRICATPEKIESAQYAMDATKATLEYFNAYFEYPYPFGKLDQIGVADFRAGAMENTGAVIYRESALLADPERATESQRRRVASVVAHEIAHMWFGDLVTMRWWNDIWLNEGFASFMEDKLLATWRPEWNVDLIIASAPGWAMSSDVLQATRQIRTDGDTPAEIESFFDGIAYSKTSAVLHMVESLIGEDAMQRGLSDYMRRHAYGNTIATDFFDALSRAAGEDVGAIMRSFVDQPGIPVVSVESTCDGDETVVQLAQQRFFVDREKLGGAPEQRWQVPVCFDETTCVVLTEREQEVRLDGCRDPLVANHDGRGYYLTAYGPGSQRAIVDAIDTLSPSERKVLLRDEWYLVRVGQRAIGDYLDLVAALAPTERERRVVTEYLDRLVTMDDYLVEGADRETFEGWIRDTLAPLADDLGWAPRSGEPTELTELRAAVLTALGRQGADPEVRAKARVLANEYVDDRNAVHPSLATTVVHLAAIDGDADLFDRYLAEYEQATDPEESRRFMGAVARFEDPDLSRAARELVLTDTIKTQDVVFFLYSSANRSDSIEELWTFVTDNWDALGERIPPRHQAFLVTGVGGARCEAGAAEEVAAFVGEKGAEVVPRNLTKAEERVAACLDLESQHQAGLATYLGRAPSRAIAN